jgi:hypothetical protein
MHALTEEIHTIFSSKNFYFLHFSIFWATRISRCGKIGPCFCTTFFAFDANRVFKNDRLNRGNPYVFLFKKLLLFTFFSFFNFCDSRKWRLFF